MNAPPLVTAFTAVSIFVSMTILAVSPVHGQSCTPSADSGEAARSGASLTNPAGQTIVASRLGERGLDATASATNHGTVVTCGEVHEYQRDDGSPAQRRAHAVNAISQSGDATAANSGLIETSGQGARGLQAATYSDTATARATNQGRVVTRGDVYDGTRHFGYPHFRTTDGVAAFTEIRSSTGDAIAVNERNSAGDAQSGVIEVYGTGAHGIWTYTTGTGEARGINRGDITTRGDAFRTPGGYAYNAAGVSSESDRGNATAINERGAVIHTHGDGAPGLVAAVHGGTGAGTDVGRVARAENHGTITVSGDSVLIEDYEQDDDPSLYVVGH